MLCPRLDPETEKKDVSGKRGLFKYRLEFG